MHSIKTHMGVKFKVYNTNIEGVTGINVKQESPVTFRSFSRWYIYNMLHQCNLCFANLFTLHKHNYTTLHYINVINIVIFHCHHNLWPLHYVKKVTMSLAKIIYYQI